MGLVMQICQDRVLMISLSTCQSEHAWRQSVGFLCPGLQVIWLPPVSTRQSTSSLTKRKYILIFKIELNNHLGICRIASVNVMIFISQAEIIEFQTWLFMINGDNSVFWPHLAWLLHICKHEVFLLTFIEPNIALCQCERQSKRQAGEAVIQSEVLRISPGSSSFSNYPPGGILAVLDNNESPGVCLSPLKCGWRKHTRGAGRINVCFAVMSSEEHKSKTNLHCWLSGDEAAQTNWFSSAWHVTHNFLSSCGCDNETCSLKVILCSEIKCNYQVAGVCFS